MSSTAKKSKFSTILSADLIIVFLGFLPAAMPWKKYLQKGNHTPLSNLSSRFSSFGQTSSKALFSPGYSHEGSSGVPLLGISPHDKNQTGHLSSNRLHNDKKMQTTNCFKLFTLPICTPVSRGTAIISNDRIAVLSQRTSLTIITTKKVLSSKPVTISGRHRPVSFYETKDVDMVTYLLRIPSQELMNNDNVIYRHWR